MNITEIRARTAAESTNLLLELVKHPRIVALLPLDNDVDKSITVWANRSSTSFMVIDHENGTHPPRVTAHMSDALLYAKTWGGWTS
jgi:hypothetical protein